MSNEGDDGDGTVVELAGRRVRTRGSGTVTEDQAARLLRNYYRAYAKGETIDPSELQIEAMIDALVLTFELRLVLS